MDPATKSLKGKLKRAQARLEVLQNEAYEYELRTGIEIEGLMNDATAAVEGALVAIEFAERQEYAQKVKNAT